METVIAAQLASMAGNSSFPTDAIGNVNSASISGTLLSSLMLHLFSHGSMAVETLLFGCVETTNELSDTDANTTKHHVVIRRWSDIECPSSSSSEAAEVLLGICRLRKRSPHILTFAEVQHLQLQRYNFVLLVTENDPEVGSNAVDISLFQRRAASGHIAPVAMSISNLVASANRFDSIANTVVRFGSYANHGEPLDSSAASRESHCQCTDALLRFTKAQRKRLDDEIGHFNTDFMREMQLMRELTELMSQVEVQRSTTHRSDVVVNTVTLGESTGSASSDDDNDEANELYANALNASASFAKNSDPLDKGHQCAKEAPPLPPPF
jgi:hypothetical protein